MPEKPQVDLGLLNIDTLIAETKKEPFRFTLAGKVRELPHFSTITPKQALALDKGEVEEVLTEIVGDLATEILTLPGFAADAVLEGWMNHAGTAPGE